MPRDINGDRPAKPQNQPELFDSEEVPDVNEGFPLDDPFAGWNDDIMSPALRSKLYALAVSVGNVLCFYGVATQQEVSMWIGVGINALAVTTAFVHRPTRKTKK